MTRGGAGEERADQSTGEVSPWEWVVAAAGALVVLFVVAFLLRDAARGPDTPPVLTVRVDSIVPTPGGWLVELTVANTGHSTAAEVPVEATLRQAGEVVETSTVRIDYVPEQAERTAGVYFTRDPRRHQLEIVPRGYESP